MKDVGRFVDRFIGHLGSFGIGVGAVSVVIMIAMIFVHVIARRAFDIQFKVADEFGGYLLVIIVFMGFAYCLRKGKIINVELIFRRFPNKVKGLLEIVHGLLGILLVGIYVWSGWKLVMTSFQLHILSTVAIDFPLWIPQSVMLVGLSFFMLELLAYSVKKFAAFSEIVRNNENSHSSVDKWQIRE